MSVSPSCYQRRKKSISRSPLCHSQVVDSLLTYVLDFYLHFSDEVWRYAWPAYWPLWYPRTACNVELLLSKVDVLVPDIDGNRRVMPLVLLAYVRIIQDYRSPVIEFQHFRTILQGKTSHKFIDMNENPIMHVYYTNRTVLGFMCLFNELFYAALYLLYFTPGPISQYSYIFFELYLKNLF